MRNAFQTRILAVALALATLGVCALAGFNFSNALQNGRDLNAELRTLGKEYICQIHCTDQDGEWLQNDPKIDMPKVKQTLDEMGWSGWLVMERSRDKNDSRNVKKNYGANAAYLKSIFQK